MDLKPRISKSLNQVGIVDYFLIAVQHGAAIKPASTGPVKCKGDEQAQAPKQLLIIENGIEGILTHLRKGSESSKALRDLLGQLGYVTYKKKGGYSGKRKA